MNNNILSHISGHVANNHYIHMNASEAASKMFQSCINCDVNTFYLPDWTGTGYG